MTVSLLVSAAANGVIGRDGNQDWRIKADLERLKSLTMSHHIVMGRKTHQAIGRPLPGRTNIVLSRQENFQEEGCHTARSLEQAFQWARDAGDTEVFVLGGGEVYRQALTLADRVYMTRLADPFPGDTRFPELGPEWHVVLREDHRDEEPVGYLYLIYERVAKRNIDDEH